MAHAAISASEQERDRIRKAKVRKAARDIKVGKVKNPARKKEAAGSLVAFAESYFTKPPNEEKYPSKHPLISAALSPAHLHVVGDMQEVILESGNEAVVAPRGFGKDTWALIAILWGAMNGHIPFAVFACYTLDQAATRINAIKSQLEINQWLAEDYPEVIDPIRALERSYMRANLQTYNGSPTYITFGQQIILPSIPKSKASGAIIIPASLSASVRGLNIDGQRPTHVFVSDPQTRATAKSLDETEKIMSVINADFGGLGSHTEPCSFFPLMTIIKKGDVADQLTDRKKNPAYRGIRYQAVSRWPDGWGEDSPDESRPWAMWLKYFELKDYDANQEPPTRTAYQFYKDNRAKMDAGFDVYWDAHISRKGRDGEPLELSGQQHLMNIYWERGHDAFFTEMQNDPPETEVLEKLDPEAVAKRLSEFPQGTVPPGSRLVQAIDFQARYMQYQVVALRDDFSGVVIDYANMALPGAIGTEVNALAASEDDQVKQAIEQAIEEGLIQRRDELQHSPYRDADGRAYEIELTLVDTGYMPRPIYQFVRASGQRWRAIKGEGFRHARPSPTVKVGEHYHAQFDQVSGIWLYHLDSDELKHAALARYTQDVGTPGAFQLFAAQPRNHMDFARQITREPWDPEKRKFIKKGANHQFDNTAMCICAGEMIGLRITRPPVRALKPRPRLISKGKSFWNNRR